MARLYTVPPARGAPSAGTYVSFVADYDGAGLKLIASTPPTPTLHYSVGSEPCSGSCSSITYPASSRGERYFLNS